MLKKMPGAMTEFPVAGAQAALAADRALATRRCGSRACPKTPCWAAPPRFRPKDRQRSHSGACRLRSGQSGHRIAADDSGLSGLRLRAAADCARGAASARCRRGTARENQSRPVRHRAGRHAQPLRHAPQRFRPGPCAGRLVVRLGGGGGRGNRKIRIGHRHRRVGPGAGCVRQYCRHKPTLGSVSTRGLVPACRSLDTVTVLSRTVDEGFAVLRVIAGFDADDPYSRRAPFAHLRKGAMPAASRIAAIAPPAKSPSFSSRQQHCLGRRRSRSTNFWPWRVCSTTAPGLPRAPKRFRCGRAASRHSAPGHAFSKAGSRGARWMRLRHSTRRPRRDDRPKALCPL